jgi:hypothetical protein
VRGGHGVRGNGVRGGHGVRGELAGEDSGLHLASPECGPGGGAAPRVQVTSLLL